MLACVSFKYWGQWQTLSGYRGHKRTEKWTDHTQGGNREGQGWASCMLLPLSWDTETVNRLSTGERTVNCPAFRGRIFQSEFFLFDQVATLGSVSANLSLSSYLLSRLVKDGIRVEVGLQWRFGVSYGFNLVMDPFTYCFRELRICCIKTLPSISFLSSESNTGA